MIWALVTVWLICDLEWSNDLCNYYTGNPKDCQTYLKTGEVPMYHLCLLHEIFRGPR